MMKLIPVRLAALGPQRLLGRRAPAQPRQALSGTEQKPVRPAAEKDLLQRLREAGL